jgi:hypothetical protein
VGELVSCPRAIPPLSCFCASEMCHYLVAQSVKSQCLTALAQLAHKLRDASNTASNFALALQQSIGWRLRWTQHKETSKEASLKDP